MKNKNIKKSNVIILSLTVLVLILGVSLFIAMSNNNEEVTSNPQDSSRELKSEESKEEPIDFREVNDETVQQLIEIYTKAHEYKGKEITIEGQLFDLDDGYSVGKKHPQDETYIINIRIKPETDDMMESYKQDDWIKVTGKIEIVEEAHDDHSHETPILLLESVESVKPHKN